MKRLIALVAAALLFLSGCSAGSAPERVTAQFLDKLIEGNVKSAEKHTLSGSLTLSSGNKAAAAIYKPLFAMMQYTVGGAVTDGDTATVNVTLLVVDMEELMSEISLEMVQQVLASGSKDDELFYTLMLEKLESGEAAMESFTVSAYLVKDGGRWKLDLENSGSFARAVGGGVKGLVG